MTATREMFQANLAWGQAAETAIALWLRQRGNNILPVYDNEYHTGKGPRFFLREISLVAPDHLIFGAKTVFWAECKHKSVFTWHRLSKNWQTGIDRRHYTDYLRVAEETGLPIWLFFLHDSPVPSSRDLRSGSPATCPTGLFATNIIQRFNHQHENHGPSGMVYWNASSLMKLAERDEVLL